MAAKNAEVGLSTLRPVSLDDKYLSIDGNILINGSQALVRLMLEQSRADQRAGLNTAGFVSGYRGSPLGGVDQTFWRAATHLDQANIRFEPGLNEDLAATAVWGTQQTELLGGGPYDGVFGLWYGKNPGVDRSGDVFKHGNINGTSAHGGMLAISGDDPGATSSTIPNQCEHTFAANLMPVLYPADIADIIAFGRFGFEMSRYSGLWVAMKTVADTVESTATIDIGGLPNSYVTPENPVSCESIITRWPDDRWSQDRRLQEVKLPAAMAFAAANRIDKIVLGKKQTRRRFGIITAGKAFLDVLEALEMLGINETIANEIGLSVYKVAMIWPLEPTGLGRFAQGLEDVIVVEERRAFLETQIKEIAYHWDADSRPNILGKTDLAGNPMFSSLGETTPHNTAEILGKYLVKVSDHPTIRKGLKAVKARKSVLQQQAPALSPPAMRIPHFCAGCPHSRSTELPENSTAMAGIGCHSLAMWMEGGKTRLLTHMGGEGANWIGAAPFVDMPHIFQNMGDGTYNHSGMLAIRSAVAAKTTITYKILYNDAVAMTGGQTVEGAPGVGDIARQMLAERVGKVVVVSDHPESLKTANLPTDAPLFHRDQLNEVMEDCRKFPGVSVLIYDQVCATEKRRRIKTGIMPQPESRVMINQRVCEGCGDCSLKSGCVAIENVETPFGIKRRINQSVCNTDLSCLDGFCPAMVTIEGARIKKTETKEINWQTPLPEPTMQKHHEPLNILIAGVGGTGLITIGAILGMATHIDGKSCTILDNTGLARKGGGVTTHLRISTKKHNHAPRIDIVGCDLLLAGDPIIAASSEVITRLASGHSHAIVNSHAIPTAAQARHPNSGHDIGKLLTALKSTTGTENCMAVDVSTLAKNLLGNEIFANMILLGIAWQNGHLPVSKDALKRAIELNGIAVEANLQAFTVGRRYAENPKAVLEIAKSENKTESEPIEATIARLAEDLAQSRNESLAAIFKATIKGIGKLEGKDAENPGSLSRIIARNYHRLLAYKDEYEVARLMTNGEFDRALAVEFEDITKIRYHFASPMLGVHGDKQRGFKKSFGPWLRPVLSILARIKTIRNTIADPFRYQADRKLEQQLITHYADDIARIENLMQNGASTKVTKLANWPENIRGFGPVKKRNAEQALQLREELLCQFHKSDNDHKGS